MRPCGWAQEVGFDKVAALAKAAGITSVRATPAIALGAYDATPLEMAGAYTVFANGGTRLSPLMVKSVRDARGNVLNNYHSDTKQVLDPRVAYVHDHHDGSRGRTMAPAIRCGRAASKLQRRARPGPRMTPGSPATPAICCASSGWATTTTPTSSWRAARPPRLSGRNS